MSRAPVYPTPNQHTVLVAWHALGAPTMAAVAEKLGRHPRGLDEMVRIFVREGFMAREGRHPRLTEKGIAAALAPCPAPLPPLRARASQAGLRRVAHRGAPPVVPASPRRIRPAAFAVLAAVASLHAETKKWPSLTAVARRAGQKTSAEYYIGQLAACGLLSRVNGKGITGIPKAGRDLLAAGLEAATARLSSLPVADGPLPVTAVVSERGLAVLRVLHRRALAGTAPTLVQLAEELGVKETAVRGRVCTLRDDGLLARAHGTSSTEGGVMRLTPLALGVLDGRVMAVSAKPGPAPRPKPAPVAKAPKASPVPRVRAVKPEPAPRPIAHTPDAEPLPPPALPPLSPAVATWRGLVHPLPPLAHAKPKGFAGTTWNHATTLPSMQRRA